MSKYIEDNVAIIQLVFISRQNMNRSMIATCIKSWFLLLVGWGKGGHYHGNLSVLSVIVNETNQINTFFFYLDVFYVSSIMK